LNSPRKTRLMFSFPRRMPSDDYQFRQFSHVHFPSFSLDFVSLFNSGWCQGHLLSLRNIPMLGRVN
jgi:hypothetical protein